MPGLPGPLRRAFAPARRHSNIRRGRWGGISTRRHHFKPGVFSAINWREGYIDANNHKSHRRVWRAWRDVSWIGAAGARAVLPLSAAATPPPPPGYYGGGYYGAPPPPPRGYYGGGYYRPQRWNGCPKGFTVQDGVCKPYRGY